MTDDSADPDDSILAIAIPNWMPVKSVKIGIVEPLLLDRRNDDWD